MKWCRLITEIDNVLLTVKATIKVITSEAMNIIEANTRTLSNIR